MKKNKINQNWNLGLLYKSPKDPQIEKDVVKIERLYADFAKKYDVKEKTYLTDGKALLTALTEYEKISGDANGRPILYFYFLSHMDSRNTEATSQISLISNRLTNAGNLLVFFVVSLGTIRHEFQQRFLKDASLAHFHVLLQRIFEDAKHTLSVPEEKIMNLKGRPAYDMWVQSFERTLGDQTVKWKGKVLPLPEAQNLLSSLSSSKDRRALSALISGTLKKVSAFAEAEINAVVTNKKINDELRKYGTPFQDTVLGYRNDPKVIEKLIETVSSANSVAHSFYKLKSKLIKEKKLAYADRGAKIGTVKVKFSFDQSAEILKNTFGAIDKKYADILQSYLENGQIDALPRMGKLGGAYCWGSYGNPTFVLLNHVNDLYSLKTFAHEMGHAFHTDLSKAQGPIYSDYSTALAETASTLFESIAIESIFESLSDKEKIIVLHDKINDDISTIFRQVACFNFEKDIHKTVREKGFISKENLSELHNKNMKAYLGPAFELTPADGYFWVAWSHIRRFFYVYSYAYGMLVSKALLRRYRKDPTFWKSIEKFLSAGGKASPEEILAEIGINLSSPDFWKEGIAEIEEDITKLEKLSK